MGRPKQSGVGSSHSWICVSPGWVVYVASEGNAASNIPWSRLCPVSGAQGLTKSISAPRSTPTPQLCVSEAGFSLEGKSWLYKTPCALWAGTWEGLGGKKTKKIIFFYLISPKPQLTAHKQAASVSPAPRDALFLSRLRPNLGSAGFSNGATTEKLQILTPTCKKEATRSRGTCGTSPQAWPWWSAASLSPLASLPGAKKDGAGIGVGCPQLIQAVPEPV